MPDPANPNNADNVPPAAGEEIEPVSFRRHGVDDEGLDMTPMVDITFLLLIFFMVTAAFAMQKSIKIPAPDQQESATQRIEPDEVEDDYVVVEIDRDDTVWVNGVVARSKQQVLIELRDNRLGASDADPSSGPAGMLVMADPDCHHETVVMVLDAGNAAQMEPIRLATAEEGEFGGF
jgi:biopolymer transport protein ExbD